MPQVQALLLLRPTKSKGLYIQQIGRGLRILTKENIVKSECFVLDEVGNSYRHGLVDGEHILSGSELMPKKTEKKRMAHLCKHSKCQILVDKQNILCKLHVIIK